MDGLMAALVLGAICQLGDRTPRLAAILADRFRRPMLVIGAALFALALNYAVGMAGGMLLRPLLTPNAASLLLAFALLLAGVGTSWRGGSPDRLSGWHIGAGPTVVLGLVIVTSGDRMQFIAAALAAQAPLPWLVPVGATLGALAIVVPAVMLGEAAWLRLPLRALRVTSGTILIVAGAVIGLRAIRLL